MSIIKINNFESQPIIIQVNDIKSILVEKNVILGRKFTFEIATLIVQMEKLIGYYDTKKIPSRFKAQYKTMELMLSTESTYISRIDAIRSDLSQIKIKFELTENNIKKKRLCLNYCFFI